MKPKPSKTTQLLPRPDSSRALFFVSLRQAERMNGVRFIALLSAVWVPLLWADDYPKQVLADKPSLYFRYDQVEGSAIKSEVGGLEGTLAGNASIADHGPRDKAYPDFASKNAALKLSGAGQFLRIKDPGAESILDFAQGDSITMEAWVNPQTMGTVLLRHRQGAYRQSRPES